MLTLSLVHSALAAEFRRIELADGRTLTGEVLQLTDNGLTLRVPQGDTDIDYADVLRLDPVDQSAFASDPPLRILILPTGGGNPLTEETADHQLRAAFTAVPATRVSSLEELPTSISESARNALRGCGLDTTCVVTASSAVPADVVVMPMVRLGDGVEEMVLASVWLNAPRAQRRIAMTHPPGASARAVEVATAAWQVLGLRAPNEATRAQAEVAARAAAGPSASEATPTPLPPPVAPPPASKADDPRPTAAPVPEAFVWVPLPGFPAWVGGRPVAGAIATAVVVPATAALVYVAGREAPSLPGALAIGSVGYYAFCVVSNRMVAPVLVTPTEGGAQVTVGGTF